MEEDNFTRSKALNEYKKMVGNVNHYLITILIGLDGVKQGKVEKGETFSTTWNPKDISASSERSRQFAIKAALAWSVDAVDAYYIMIDRQPKILVHKDLTIELEKDSVSKSVALKHSAVRKFYDFCEIEYALIGLAIIWRNRVVHNFAENELSSEIKNILIENKEKIALNYNGLDIDEMIKNLESKDSVPKFKEITSLISGSIRYITEFDKILVTELDLNSYIEQVIKYHILKQNHGKNKKEVINTIWSKKMEIKARKLINIVSMYGCNITSENTIIQNLVNLNTKSAFEYFGVD